MITKMITWIHDKKINIKNLDKKDNIENDNKIIIIKVILKIKHKNYNNNCSGPCKLDSRCVLVRRIFSSGKPQGVGILEWGGDGEGMEMGRSVYEQPGTKVDGILSHQGGFPSK